MKNTMFQFHIQHTDKNPTRFSTPVVELSQLTAKNLLTRDTAFSEHKLGYEWMRHLLEPPNRVKICTC